MYQIVELQGLLGNALIWVFFNNFSHEKTERQQFPFEKLLVCGKYFQIFEKCECK